MASIITCRRCGRPVAEALDPLAKVQATCSSCLPDPVAMIRFSLAAKRARKLSGHKVAYCAARVGISSRAWLLWESGIKQRPPYDRKDQLLSLFADTKAAHVMVEEVQGWPR